MSNDNSLVKEMLERDVPVRSELAPDWSDVLVRVERRAEVDLGEPLQPAAPRKRRRIGRSVWIAAAAAGAVVAALLAAPWGADADFADRALAAIGQRPIVHAVVERGVPYSAVVEVATGDERPVRLRVEWLVDSRGGSQDWWTSVDGGPRRHSTTGSPDPALTAFATGYREALADGRVHVVGEGTFEGRKTKILRVDAGNGQSSTVTVDAETYLPLTFGAVSGERDVWRVVAIESVDREPPGLTRDTPQTGLSADVAELRRLPATEAALALGVRALWPGARVGSLELTSIRLQRLTTSALPGFRRQKESLGLLLYYEGSGSWLEVAETKDWEVAYGFYGPRLAANGPLPAEGELRIDCDACGGDHAPGYKPIWQAQLQTNGLYFRVRAPSRELTLRAARSLEPMH